MLSLSSSSLSLFFQSSGDPFRPESKRKEQDLLQILQKTFFLTRLGAMKEKKEGKEKKEKKKGEKREASIQVTSVIIWLSLFYSILVLFTVKSIIRPSVCLCLCVCRSGKLFSHTISFFVSTVVCTPALQPLLLPLIWNTY